MRHFLYSSLTNTLFQTLYQALAYTSEMREARATAADRSPDTFTGPEVRPPCPPQIRLAASLIKVVHFIFSHRGLIRYKMTDTLIGYARCSTDKQDLTAQRRALIELGVPEDRIYTDHGLTGRNRDRPGLAQALAAVRAGETLVVPKLDRLARSVPDARAIADDLEKRGVSLALGKQVYGLVTVLCRSPISLCHLGFECERADAAQI